MIIHTGQDPFGFFSLHLLNMFFYLLAGGKKKNDVAGACVSIKVRFNTCEHSNLYISVLVILNTGGMEREGG